MHTIPPLKNMIPCYGLRPPQVAAVFGSVEIFKRVRHAGWIKPVVQQKRLTLFDAGDVALVWQRIRAGELPPMIPRKTLGRTEGAQ